MTAPAAEPKVSPLELFFDLVFVFAITQVTALLATDPSWEGLARGLLVLAAVWWAWVGYAWLGNQRQLDEGVVRIAIFAAMAAMLIVALAVPRAFNDDALIFGVALLVVRAIQISLLEHGSRGDPQVHRAAVRLAPFMVLGPALIVGASFLDGEAQAAVWAAALLLDYSGGLFAGTGWRVSPEHFHERHGLIVIVALGESIVAIGVGADAVELTHQTVVAAVLGIAIVASLWWAYFDVVAVVAGRRLREVEGAARSAMARDSYSYLHLPMVAGIVLLALGIKKTLSHVDAPLETVPAVAACAGVALYLLGHIGFRLRNVGTFNPHRAVATVLCLATIPIAREVDALATLAILAVISCGLIAYEALRFAEARARVRAG